MEILRTELDVALSQGEKVTNSILSKNKLQFQADFNSKTIDSDKIDRINETTSYQADFNLKPLSSQLNFNSGEYRAEKTIQFIAFLAGIGHFLEAVARAQKSMELKALSPKLSAEIKGTADGDGFNSTLNIVYSGEYGETISQKNVIVNGEKKDLYITRRNIKNSELAFLRAYSIAQTLVSVMVEKKIDHEILKDVSFVVQEFKETGSDFRVGLIKLDLQIPKSYPV